MPPFTCLRSTRATIRIEPAEYLGETRRKVLEKILSAPIDVIPRADIVPAHYSITPGACSRSALRTYLIHIRAPIPSFVPAHCATERRSQGTIRLRRIFGIGDASPDADDAWAAHLALKPAQEAPSSRSQSAAVVPDVNAPSRTVRPPFGLFDPSSAGLGQFQPTAFKTPVHTSVATEFNSGERTYSTIKPRSPSIRNSVSST